MTDIKQDTMIGLSRRLDALTDPESEIELYVTIMEYMLSIGGTYEGLNEFIAQKDLNTTSSPSPKA